MTTLSRNFSSNAFFSFRFYLRSGYNRPNKAALFPVLEVWEAFKAGSLHGWIDISLSLPVNATFGNRTKSVDWVRSGKAIKRNRTPHFLWARFPNQSKSIEQIDPKIQDSVYLPFYLLYWLFINISMYGEVTSRNHQAYSWGHLVHNNTVA